MDYDSFDFHAAAASQKDSVKITNKKTGEEVLEEYTKLDPIYDITGEVIGHDEIKDYRRFKNKTSFHGRGKADGGWLLKYNNNLPESKQPLTRDDFLIETVTIPDPETFAIRNLESSLNSLRKMTGVDKLEGGIAAEVDTNFRLDLKLPVKYKSCRDGLARPVHLKFLKNYTRKEMGAKIVEGMEVDDLIQMYATKAYKVYKEEGWLPYLVFTEDKDNLSTISSAVIWNPRKEEGKFKFEAPFLVEGLGEIWEGSNSTIKGYGFKHLCYQMLYGDPQTDGFSPTKGFGKRFGVKAILKALDKCDTAKACVETINDTYKVWFEEEVVKFSDYKGTKGKLADTNMKDVEVTLEEWKEVIFQCLYMKRSYKDNTTWKGLCNKLGAEGYE